MYLHENIKEKFINEASDIMIDSLDNYSEYIQESKDFQFFYELVPYHLVGYRVCENFLTENRKYSAFDIINDYLNDYLDMFGDAPKDINSEYVFQFYLDTYLSRLSWVLESSDIFENKEASKSYDNFIKKATEIIENFRAEEIAELYKF